MEEKNGRYRYHSEGARPVEDRVTSNAWNEASAGATVVLAFSSLGCRVMLDAVVGNWRRGGRSTRRGRASRERSEGSVRRNIIGNMVGRWNETREKGVETRKLVVELSVLCIRHGGRG